MERYVLFCSDGGEYIFYKEGTDYGADACYEKEIPRLGAEVILCFDDNGMEQPDDEEGG